MKWHIIAVGKPSLAYAKSGVEEYGKRLKRYASVDVHYLQRDEGKERNGALQLRLSEGGIRLVLDERGKSWSTRDFSGQVEKWQLGGVKRASILIGGADGHSDEVRAAADQVISLSGFTLQHELALLVLMEQIYRVHTVLRGEPYHRD